MTPKLNLPATPSGDHSWQVRKNIDSSNNLFVLLIHYGNTVWSTEIYLASPYQNYLHNSESYQELLDIISKMVTKEYEKDRTRIENEYHLFKPHTKESRLNMVIG